MERAPRIWVLLGHRRGDNNQLLALAQALGLPFETRSMRYNILRKVSKRLLDDRLVSVRPSARKWLQPPWPDLVMGIGHRSVPVARHIRNASGGRSKLVQLGNPRIHPRNFDLVITMPQYGLEEHSNVVRLPLAMDSPHGPNVTTDQDRAFFEDLPRPHRLLVLGGPNKHWLVTPDDAARAARTLVRRSGRDGGTVLAIGSPRTPSEVLDAAEKELKGSRHRFVRGPVPGYRSLLEDADEIHVTADSVSMISEAVFTGKPVGVVPIRQNSRGKRHERLQKLGLRSAPRPNLRAVWASLEENQLVGTLDKPRAAAASNPVSKAVAAVLDLLGARAPGANGRTGFNQPR
jgi:mitochondrial fission protein ELM1